MTWNASKGDRRQVYPQKNALKGVSKGLFSDSSTFYYSFHVDPGLINPWLIHRGVSPFSGDSDHFWREHPHIKKQGFMNPGSTLLRVSGGTCERSMFLTASTVTSRVKGVGQQLVSCSLHSGMRLIWG